MTTRDLPTYPLPISHPHAGVFFVMHSSPIYDKEAFLKQGKDAGEDTAPVNRVPTLTTLAKDQWALSDVIKGELTAATTDTYREFYDVWREENHSSALHLLGGTCPVHLPYLLPPAQETRLLSPSHMTAWTITYFSTGGMKENTKERCSPVSPVSVRPHNQTSLHTATHQRTRSTGKATFL